MRFIPLLSIAIQNALRYFPRMTKALFSVVQCRFLRVPGKAVGNLYALTAPRAASVFVFGALFCTLLVKLFHASRYGMVREYPTWILTDVAVLVTIEATLASICTRWRKIWIVRLVTTAAGLVCTWSVINACWLIRTGTQILPMGLRPMIHDPLSVFTMVAVNAFRMPAVGLSIFIPSAIAILFYISVMVKPVLPAGNGRRSFKRTILSLLIVCISLVADAAVVRLGSAPIASAGLRFNCHSRAILEFVLPEYRRTAKEDFSNPTRDLPTCNDVNLPVTSAGVKHNVVIVILEGVQYAFTSLAEPASPQEQTDPTPYLATLAAQGASFTNARSTLTHTTKAIFALLTGRYPSAAQDIAETIPVPLPYAGLPTILNRELGYRTAFFQSAKGTFESRPGLIHNLGFEKFSARENLDDPNAFVGYLGCDEFTMLQPIGEWIASDERPFLLVVLCSVTHDPYVVPRWFGEPAETPVERYRQTICYTDQFLRALDIELTSLSLADRTIFCVVGDHGEAFGEHRLLGHERIPYEEALRIPICMRAPLLIEPGTRVDSPVSSVDLTPTLLRLLGFDTSAAAFDGIDALTAPPDRKVYFSGWLQQGPAGFVKESNKFIYDPEDATASLWRLKTDPLETNSLPLPDAYAQEIGRDVTDWRKRTVFRLHQEESGQTILFDRWQCKWSGRLSSVKHLPPEQ
jgi:hypothetical protein